MNKFLVIVHPAPPATREIASSQQWSPERAPQVKWVTARSPQLAVEQVSVAPGGYALVVPEPDVVRFDRAKQAPLVEKRPDGNPLDQAVKAA